MAVGHPLAAEEVVSVEDLAVYPDFAVLQNPLYPTTTPSGLPIARCGVARTFAEVLALVARKENERFPGNGVPAEVLRSPWRRVRADDRLAPG